MSTESQIRANRENSKRSTGPVTASGKAVVSRNRTIHGLNYNAATFRVLPCEDQADYDSLVAALIKEQEPCDTVEHLLVVSMAQHRWLLDRATRLQETCFDPKSGKVADQKLFALYLRYANTHERAFHKCFNDLVKLRVDNKKLELGFESASRMRERHNMHFDMHALEKLHREWQIWREKTDYEDAKVLQNWQQEQPKAA